MKRVWRVILDQIDRDQLFSQVLNVIAGSTMIGSGLWLIYEILPDGGLGVIWLEAALILIAVIIIGWGLVLFAASFAARESRFVKFADKYFPDASGEEFIVIMVIWCVPAYMVTLLLRLFGVQGRPNQAK
jgi:threonine/homoserine/homoserine lactone efflux protein